MTGNFTLLTARLVCRCLAAPALIQVILLTRWRVLFQSSRKASAIWPQRTNRLLALLDQILSKVAFGGVIRGATFANFRKMRNWLTHEAQGDERGAQAERPETLMRRVKPAQRGFCGSGGPLIRFPPAILWAERRTTRAALRQSTGPLCRCSGKP